MKHVAGKKNIPAEALSRIKWDEYMFWRGGAVEVFQSLINKWSHHNVMNEIQTDGGSECMFESWPNKKKMKT